MAMYQFSFEPLLNHRKAIEEQLQKELAALQKLLRDQQEDFFRCRDAKTRMLHEFQERQRQDTTVSEILVYVTFIDQISRRLETKEKGLGETEMKIHEKRKDLVSALKNRKTLDTLKEKGLQAFNENTNRTEQEFMNEVAINQFVRRL